MGIDPASRCSILVERFLCLLMQRIEKHFIRVKRITPINRGATQSGAFIGGGLEIPFRAVLGQVELACVARFKR
jgi:hypothetical protein